LIITDIQCVSPPNIETERIQSLLIAQGVKLLQETQPENARNAEIRSSCFSIEHGIPTLVPEQYWKDFGFEQASP
jgi:hypothetical protein